MVTTEALQTPSGTFSEEGDTEREVDSNKKHIQNPTTLREVSTLLCTMEHQVKGAEDQTRVVLNFFQIFPLLSLDVADPLPSHSFNRSCP